MLTLVIKNSKRWGLETGECDQAPEDESLIAQHYQMAA